MIRSRKGASPELVFLVSVFIIALVIVFVYVYLASETLGAAEYQVKTNAGIIKLDAVITGWAQGVIASGSQDPALSLQKGFEAEGWCGLVSCGEEQGRTVCRFSVLRRPCPQLPEVIYSASKPYARTFFMPEQGKAKAVVLQGRFE